MVNLVANAFQMKPGWGLYSLFVLLAAVAALAFSGVLSRRQMESERTPAATPAPAPAAQPANRGLYITIGAVFVLAVLVMAGIYVPKYAKTHALGGNTAATAPAAPATAAPTPAPAAPAVAAPPAAPAPAAATPAKPQAASAAAPPPGPDPKQLQALRDQIDQLTSRAAAVNAGLDSLEKQQEAQGYGLRGDMVASQQRMQTDIARAESALQAKDVDSAQQYLGMGETEAEKLEKFLGR